MKYLALPFRMLGDVLDLTFRAGMAAGSLPFKGGVAMGRRLGVAAVALFIVGVGLGAAIGLAVGRRLHLHEHGHEHEPEQESGYGQRDEHEGVDRPVDRPVDRTVDGGVTV